MGPMLDDWLVWIDSLIEWLNDLGGSESLCLDDLIFDIQTFAGFLQLRLPCVFTLRSPPSSPPPLCTGKRQLANVRGTVDPSVMIYLIDGVTGTVPL
mgnify:CR=1 FL=1